MRYESLDEMAQRHERCVKQVYEGFREEAKSWPRERVEEEIAKIEGEIAKSPGYVQEYKQGLAQLGWPQKYGPGHPGNRVWCLLEALVQEDKLHVAMQDYVTFLKTLLLLGRCRTVATGPSANR